MPDHTHKLSNGAAHVAYAILQSGTKSSDDIWIGGGLMLKLKAVKKLPAAEKDESAQAYTDRVEAWLESPMGEVSMTEAERDVLKAAWKVVEEKKELPDGIFKFATREMIDHLGLHK